MKAPRFSIVIPTKNRTEPLKQAILSVLEQEFQDWECIVVDNNQDERAEKVCREFPDPRIRRVRTGGLHMADNWDAGILAARGEYVALIEDKQCFYGHALAMADKMIRETNTDCLLWRGDVLDDRGGTYHIGGRTGDRELYKIFPDQLLADFTFEKKTYWKNPTHFPKEFIVCSLSVVRRSLLENIRVQTGQKICLPVNPELTMGCHLLNAVESYYYFHGSMTFYHSVKLSNGGNVHANKGDVNNFWADMGGEEIGYRYTPIKAYFNENQPFNDYLYMRKLLGGRLSRHPLNWKMYYFATREGLARAEREGYQRISQLKAWQEALAREPLSLQMQVRAHQLKWFLKRLLKKLRNRTGLKRLEQLLRVSRKAAPIAMPGQEFKDLPEFRRAQTLELRRMDLGEAASITRPVG